MTYEYIAVSGQSITEVIAAMNEQGALGYKAIRFEIVRGAFYCCMMKEAV